MPLWQKANSLDEESTPRLRLTESPKDGTGQVSTGWKMASELWGVKRHAAKAPRRVRPLPRGGRVHPGTQGHARKGAAKQGGTTEVQLPSLSGAFRQDGSFFVTQPQQKGRIIPHERTQHILHHDPQSTTPATSCTSATVTPPWPATRWPASSGCRARKSCS